MLPSQGIDPCAPTATLELALLLGGSLLRDLAQPFFQLAAKLGCKLFSRGRRALEAGQFLPPALLRSARGLEHPAYLVRP